MTEVEPDVADSSNGSSPFRRSSPTGTTCSTAPGQGTGNPTRPPSRWRIVAIAATIVAGAALLAAPALGIGERLLSLIQSKPSSLDVQAPAWSPDGRTIVFVSWRDGNSEVYAMDANGSSPRNLTKNPAKDVQPAWSPDGHSIAFVRSRDRHQRMQPGLRTPPEQSDIYVMNADGSRERNLTRIVRATTFQRGHPTGGGSRSCTAAAVAEASCMS